MNKWISIKDKMPEEDEYVLIIDKHEGILIGRRWGGESNFWSEKCTGCGCCGSSISASYWMPLPEPPN